MFKALRDDIQKEYQGKKTQIEEEKAKSQKDSTIIAKEKVSIQSLKQDLEVNYYNKSIFYIFTNVVNINNFIIFDYYLT